ncbi:methyltransferase [Croceibacterium sp. LX-88]|uniref:Methyltransferase n=1 Tax=Croceibacterium selenioxidans TaxID=2838833 RepID=A0ABS5W2K0_9SPHN|nr:methyltransferase [Croceibacterium selenioxidans]MBT2133970.1 methyltransferase [Croceibacterium selenioxidans]
MKRVALALVVSGLALSGTAIAQGADPVAAIAAAVADAQRPETDTARDAARKPAEIVAFAGVKPGAIVAEMAPGGGYYTRILAKAVGPEGKVYAMVPAAFANRPGAMDAINALAAQYPNVRVVTVDYADIKLPEPVDLVWTTENYHDFHNGPTANVAAINSSVFSALKPGGIFFVEDHAAADGAGTTVTSTLHRIEPAAVVREMTAAGFALDAQSDLLKNPADPKTAGVRDPSVQGETEKFAMRFRKPA